VPFWRRPGVIGAAAGILVATTAGLAILRSPEAQSPAAKVAPAPATAQAQAATPAPEVKAIVAPKAARSKVEVEASRTMDTPAAATPAPPAPAQIAGAIAPRDEARAQAAELRQLEARDQVSRKAEAAGMNRAALLEARDSGAAPAPRVAAKAAAPPPSGLAALQAAPPLWTLDTLPDGSTRVAVSAPRTAHVVLLRRGSPGVEVIRPAAGSEPWLFQLHLTPGDALDLYVLSGPAADTAKLPETGPVDGFRARIHPPAKK
jgi:hypothetical protein